MNISHVTYSPKMEVFEVERHLQDQTGGGRGRKPQTLLSGRGGDFSQLLWAPFLMAIYLQVTSDRVTNAVQGITLVLNSLTTTNRK